MSDSKCCSEPVSYAAVEEDCTSGLIEVFDDSDKEEERANLVERLDKASTAYGMEISAEKTKLMTNNTSGINTEIKVNGRKL